MIFSSFKLKEMTTFSSSPCPWARSPHAGGRLSSRTGRPSSPWTARCHPSGPGCPPLSGGSAGRRFGQRRKDCRSGFRVHGGNAFRRRRAGQEGQKELPALRKGVKRQMKRARPQGRAPFKWNYGLVASGQTIPARKVGTSSRGRTLS